MQKIIVFFFITFLVAAGSSSCKKEKDPDIDMGYNYFPNQIGKYVVYDVDSIYYYNTPTISDTFKFQLKEKIQSTYLDNQNRTTLRLERYARYYNAAVPYSTLPWVLRDVWAENRTVTAAEKVEENVRFIKLAFAPKREKTWDGNAQNTNGEQTYSYQFIDLVRNVGGTTFDSVLQVNQKDNSSLISKAYYIEQYAKRTGMVYKQVIDVNSQPDPAFTSAQLSAFYAQPILNRVTSGFQYTFTYNTSGTE